MQQIQSRVRVFGVLLSLLMVATFAFGCASKQAKSENKRPGDPAALNYNITNFHIDMRWGRWEQAALYTDEGYRQGFLGRYDELGDDYKIVDLNIKSITIEEEVAEVDVEQESYKLPSMVVEKIRYIEVWKPVEDTWQLFERTERDDYRAEKKRLAKEKETAAEVSSESAGDKKAVDGDGAQK